MLQDQAARLGGCYALEPANYARRVLLLVAGLTPQIVTETLYALCVKRMPAFIPTEIHLLTTKEGAERARLMLLGDDPGHLQRFAEDYGLDGLPEAFPEENLHVVHGPNGAPLRDIVTEEDNAAVADAIMHQVRQLAADENCAIHASVAGGRKTMGVALALAMSLLGRRQDALSHVLVSPPFESHPEFFYPPPKPKVLLVGAPPQQRPISTEKADVQLAEIPFLRLSGLLDRTLLTGADSWRELIARAQANIGAPKLVIDTGACAVNAGGVPVKMPPAAFAFLLMMARAAKEGRKLKCPPEGVPNLEQARLLRDAMQMMHCRNPQRERTLAALARGMDKSFFERTKNKVNAALREALGPGPAAPYLIGRERVGQEFVHGLTLPPEAIEII